MANPSSPGNHLGSAVSPFTQFILTEFKLEDFEFDIESYEYDSPHTALDTILDCVLSRHPAVDLAIGDWGLVAGYYAVRAKQVSAASRWLMMSASRRTGNYRVRTMASRSTFADLQTVLPFTAPPFDC
jgi:hypothetical protein